MNDGKYDYEEAVRNDILEYLREHGYGHVSEREEDGLNDRLWVCDSVTGNGSGSYTFSTWKAESNLCHNTDLMEECAEEFCIDMSDGKTRGAEYWDVSIRRMLVTRLLHGIVEEWNVTHPEVDED